MKSSEVVDKLKRDDKYYYSLFLSILHKKVSPVRIIEYLLRTEEYDVIFKLLSPITVNYKDNDITFITIDPFSKNKEKILKMFKHIYNINSQYEIKNRYWEEYIKEYPDASRGESNKYPEEFTDMFKQEFYQTHVNHIRKQIKETIYKVELSEYDKMKMGNIYPRGSVDRSIIVKKEEDIISNFDIPCLKACLILYFEGIIPKYTECNINNQTGIKNGFCCIGLKKSMITASNKDYLDFLVERNLAFVNPNNEDDIRIVLDVSRDDNVYDISEKLAVICLGFSPQRLPVKRK